MSGLEKPGRRLGGVDAESVGSATVLAAVAGADVGAVGLGGGHGRAALECVAAVAFAGVLGAEVGVAIAVGGAGLERHAVVGVARSGQRAGPLALSVTG